MQELGCWVKLPRAHLYESINLTAQLPIDKHTAKQTWVEIFFHWLLVLSRPQSSHLVCDHRFNTASALVDITKLEQVRMESSPATSFWLSKPLNSELLDTHISTLLSEEMFFSVFSSG